MFPSCVSQRPGINRETIMDPTRARARVLDGHLILYSVLCSVRCSPYGENFAGIAELQKERATYQRHESSLIRVAGRSLNARYTFLAGGGFFLLPRSTQHNLLNPPPPSSLSLSLSLSVTDFPPMSSPGITGIVVVLVCGRLISRTRESDSRSRDSHDLDRLAECA